MQHCSVRWKDDDEHWFARRRLHFFHVVVTHSIQTDQKSGPSDADHRLGLWNLLDLAPSAARAVFSDPTLYDSER